MDLNDAERAIGYTFKDKSLLQRALTLASADKDNNQSLEFFGDAILEFIVSEKLYSEGGNEGDMTERRQTLVSDLALKPISEGLGLDKLLVRGKSDTTNKKAIPSAYEAVLAAIYLDGGMQSAKDFVYATLDFNLKSSENYKGELQEIMQRAGKPCPEYEREQTGSPHLPKFSVKLEIFGRVFTAESGSVKAAEQQAAKLALEYYEANKNGIKI